MLHPLSTLAAAAILGGGTAATQAENMIQVDVPPAPTVAVATPNAPAGPRLGGLTITTPTVTAPHPRRPHLRPVGCTASACTANDPTQFAGTVVSFDGTALTERTDSGRTYTALVDSATTVACPPQGAVRDKRVFNPVAPPLPKLGSGQAAAPVKPQIKDEYACSTNNITTGRHIAGAELGHDAQGRLHWIVIALAPS
jgi:hypothetical protein